jgi:F-type H+-transporting ATPase subunit b
MQIISNVALISINETMVFQVISFLIFLFIINRIMFRPLRQTMREREDYVNRLNQDISKAKQTLQTEIEQSKIEEDAVRAAAFHVCVELEKTGTREAHEIMEAARAEIAELSRESQQKVKTRLDEARKSVEKEAGTLALKIMEKVLERKVAL